MSKLTKKECEELAEIIGRQTGKIRCDGSASFSFIEIWKYLEQKKKEWQEEAYEKGKEDADFLNNQFNRP